MRPRHLIAGTLGCFWLAAAGASTPAPGTAAPGVSTLFGVFGVPTARARELPFTATRAGLADLPTLEASGLKALVALTGSRRNYSDARGCFQLALWKEALDRQDSAHIQALVKQGSILGLYAIDEPHDWSCGPSFEDIDSACAYALQKWPAILCGVNAPPGWLKAGASKLSHVGFLFVQYSSRKGDPDDWMRRQLDDASWFGGDIWLSIQLLQPRLSVEEARRTALTFCSARPAGVLMWKWADEWFSQPGAAEAMREVAGACGTPGPPGAASRKRRAR